MVKCHAQEGNQGKEEEGEGDRGPQEGTYPALVAYEAVVAFCAASTAA